MTAKTPTKPADTTDVWAAAERAAAVYLEALRVEFTKPPAQVDLGPHHDRLRATSDVLRPGLGDGIIAAADAVLSEVRMTAEITHTTNSDMLQRQARGALGKVVTAIDAALFRFDQQTDLDAAEANVRELNTQHAEVSAALDDAIAHARIEEVRRLRPEIELTLPVKIGQARLAVLELQLARADAQREHGARRAEPVEREVTDAEAELTAAREHVEKAQVALEAARARQAQTVQARFQVETQIRTLTAERDRLAAQAKDDHKARFRRLVGLSDVPAEQPEPAQLPQMLKPGATSFTYSSDGYDLDPTGRYIPSTNLADRVNEALSAGRMRFTHEPERLR